jgi:hypothetical protein
LPSGWYDAFLKGVAIYTRAVNEACRLAGIAGNASTPAARTQPGVASWSLWQSIVSDAIHAGVQREKDWASQVQTDPAAANWLRQLRGGPVRIILGRDSTDYQQRVATTLKRQLAIRSKSNAPRAVLIGPPAFNATARDLLCVEDTLRLKYDQGLAAVVRLNAERNAMLLAGLSDFGDDRLAAWLNSLAGGN